MPDPERGSGADEDDAVTDEETPNASASSNLILVPYLTGLLRVGLSVSSLEARRDASVPGLEQQLARIDSSEGLERIVHELRRTAALAPLEGALAIEVVPTANPAATFMPWRERMSEDHLARMHRWAELDPMRPLESRLPVGLAFDLMDMVPNEDLLRGSEVYTGIYDTLIDSWTAVVLHRDEQATWLLTGWHQIANPELRLRLRTSLQRLSPALRRACHRVGLFSLAGDPGPAIPEIAANRGPLAHGRSRFVRGFALESRLPKNQCLTESLPSAKIVASSKLHILTKNAEGLPLSEWAFEQLEVERTRLREVLAKTQAELDAVEHELKARLAFADAIPVRTFSATAVKLLEGFKTDPRPVVIYVSGTDRSCILRPADPEDVPEEVTPVGKVGQFGSRLVQQVSDRDRAPGGARIGISRGAGRNKAVVAELCPPNDASAAYIAVLRDLGELE